MYKEPVFQGVPGHGDWNPNNDVYCSAAQGGHLSGFMGLS